MSLCYRVTAGTSVAESFMSLIRNWNVPGRLVCADDGAQTSMLTSYPCFSMGNRRTVIYDATTAWVSESASFLRSLAAGSSSSAVAATGLKQCDEFTASDLLAVQLLSVQVPSRVALDLLEGGLGEEAAEFLRQIPTSVRLWDDAAEHLIKKGGPVDSVWRLLDHQDGVGWVTAGKLLARKRPSLIPVYDGVVRCALGWPKDFWQALRDTLRQDNGWFRAAVEDRMKLAGIPPAITPLRGLDVVLWMHHRSSHTGYQCSGLE
jgi:Family of unknown function (DUF6308)